MYVSIIMIVFNIVMLFAFNSIKNGENDYIKEKKRFNKIRIKYLNRYINIGYIVIFILHLFTLMMFASINDIYNLYLYLILFAGSIFTYIFFEYSTNLRNRKFKFIDKKILNNKDHILIVMSYIFFILEKIKIEYSFEGESSALDHYEFIKNYNLILKLICAAIIVYTTKYLINLLGKNRNICTYSYVDDYYYEDISFYGRIDLKKGFNHLLYLAAIGVFYYINIPFIYIFYIVLSLLLIIWIIKKYKKIVYESDRLYKSITLANKKPGLIYAFKFTKDILFFKKLIIFTIMLVFSTIIYYGLGESIFSFMLVSMYLYLLYTVLEDKIYLVRYLPSLNDNIIDKKIYTIDLNKNISYIDIIKVFNIKLYKLIIVDTIIYESNIILYDPEYRIEEINIKVNKSNIEDYITIESILYEE